MGCSFCTTSAFFGGKGKFVNFFETGDELFEVMSRIEDELKVNSFFVMDENFLLHRERAMRLLELMKHGNKSWALSVFASAKAIRKCTMLELVKLGVSWLSMGLESPQAGYSKLQGADARQLTRELREHEFVCKGRPSLGWNAIRRTTSWRKSSTRSRTTRTFTSSCCIRRCRGTPLYQQMSKAGRMLPDLDRFHLRVTQDLYARPPLPPGVHRHRLRWPTSVGIGWIAVWRAWRNRLVRSTRDMPTISRFPSTRHHSSGESNDSQPTLPRF
jgi:hypothetical protein